MKDGLKNQKIMNRRETFGSKLKDIRVLRGFSIEDVAKGTGLRDGTIKNIEAGKFSADFDIIDKIAQFFNLELALI